MESSNINLVCFLSVPPQKIRIIENNREVSSVIGPYDEGSQLSLNCIVSGGMEWKKDKRTQLPSSPIGNGEIRGAIVKEIRRIMEPSRSPLVITTLSPPLFPRQQMVPIYIHLAHFSQMRFLRSS